MEMKRNEQGKRRELKRNVGGKSKKEEKRGMREEENQKSTRAR